MILADEGDFPDVENVVMDMLSNIEVDGELIGDRSGTRTPGVAPDQPVPELYFHVFRSNAAGMNAQAWSDTAALYVAAWAPTRDKARQMIRGVRMLVAEYCDGGGYKGVLLDKMWESGGPGPLPTLDEDDRRVETTVNVRMRRHAHAIVHA